MGEVVALKRADDGPWASGPMRCLRCKHREVVVRKVPEDMVQQCPVCECFTFVAETTFEASEGEAVWTCNCGNTLMELVVSKQGAERLFCIGCGYQKPVTS